MTPSPKIRNNILLFGNESSGMSIMYSARPKKIKPISCRFNMAISLKNVGKDIKKKADKNANTGVVYFLMMKNTNTGEVANRI